MGEFVTRHGQCLCGAVRFTAKLKSEQVAVCHCSMCRRWSGGALLVVEVEEDIEFQGSDAVGVFSSSDWGERGFCKKCGTSLFWRMKGGGHTAVSAAAFDDLGAPSLTTEIFIDQKPDYYNFAEATHKMTGAEVFAAFDSEAK